MIKGKVICYEEEKKCQQRCNTTDLEIYDNMKDKTKNAILLFTFRLACPQVRLKVNSESEKIRWIGYV